MSLLHYVSAMVDDIDLLLAYLTNLDLFGFVTACYTTRIGEIFYALVMLTVSVTIYIRTQSLMYCVILWLVVGGLGFVAAAPSISVFAILLVSLAIVTLLLREIVG